MTAKEAQKKYEKLCDMVESSFRKILHTWQRNKLVDIPMLIQELRDKEKKANFTIIITMLVNIVIISSLIMGAMLLYRIFSEDHYPIFFIFLTSIVLILSIYFTDKIRGVYCFKAIEEKRKLSVKLDHFLTLLESDLSLFAINDRLIDSPTLGSKILYTALNIAEVQKKLLRLTLNGSIIANAELVESGIKDFTSLKKLFDEQIDAAKHFGREIDGKSMLGEASRKS